MSSYGKYPDVSLSRARELHDDARKLLSEGTDPMAARKAEKTALKEKSEHSFRIIGGLWLDHWRVDKSAQHVDAPRRRLEANVCPAIGDMCIAEVEVTELVVVAKEIEKRAPDLAKTSLPQKNTPRNTLCDLWL